MPDAENMQLKVQHTVENIKQKYQMSLINIEELQEKEDIQVNGRSSERHFLLSILYALNVSSTAESNQLQMLII